MFSYITGITLTEYIRRRRLSLAALELQNSEIRIIDLAVKYCYDSPDSFTRAFQRMHGITPSYVREAGVKLKSYPRMTFYIKLKGDMAMNSGTSQTRTVLLKDCRKRPKEKSPTV